MDTPAARLEKKFRRKHRLIESEIGKTQKGALLLDERDWGAATEEQRAAVVELWGRKRLYIALAP
jgi:hypothetical protein